MGKPKGYMCDKCRTIDNKLRCSLCKYAPEDWVFSAEGACIIGTYDLYDPIEPKAVISYDWLKDVPDEVNYIQCHDSEGYYVLERKVMHTDRNPDVWEKTYYKPFEHKREGD